MNDPLDDLFGNREEIDPDTLSAGWKQRTFICAKCQMDQPIRHASARYGDMRICHSCNRTWSFDKTGAIVAYDPLKPRAHVDWFWSKTVKRWIERVRWE